MGTLPYKNQGNMVDTTIYSVYGPATNLNAVGWIMHIFKFDNRRELFFCTVRQESRRQRDRNPNLNLEGISNESEYREN
jgi:hypothetical protein